MKTILIAYKDDVIRKSFGLVFSDVSCRVVATSSGVDAILKAKEIKPDIVLADVSLPDKNGYEVSREIKNDFLLKNIPVILLTSSLVTFDETRAAESRADDFMIKPFGSREMTRKVEFLISQNKERKRNIKFVSSMLVLLVIFMVMTPIVYQNIDNLPKVKSQLIRFFDSLYFKTNVNLSKVESKPLPAAEIKMAEVKQPELVTAQVSSSESGQSDGEEFSKKEQIKIETKEEETIKKDIAAVPVTQPDGKYTVQIGAFQKEETAKKIAESLASKGYPAFVKTAKAPNKETWHMIRIGTFKAREEAKLYGDNLKSREPLIKAVIVVEVEE